MEQATCCMLGCIYMYKPCYIMCYIVYTVKSQNISSTIISFISAYIWHKALKYKHTKCSILAHCKKHLTISTLTYKCMFLSFGIQAAVPIIWNATVLSSAFFLFSIETLSKGELERIALFSYIRDLCITSNISLHAC